MNVVVIDFEFCEGLNCVDFFEKTKRRGQKGISVVAELEKYAAIPTIPAFTNTTKNVLEGEKKLESEGWIVEKL